MNWKNALALFFVAGCLVAGCTSSSPTTPVKKVDDHSGWWCDEHGLPEDVCDLCSRKYREQEKAKGNWCEHNRVKTSCFKCSPGEKERWAKEYEARFGTKPPEPEPEEDEKEKKGGK